MKIPESEVRRYLGYGKNQASPAVGAMIKECADSILESVSPRYTSRVVEAVIGENGEIKIGGRKFISRSLSRAMAGCEKAVLFAATLGAQADRMIKRASLTDMARAAVLQACAASLIEEYCDVCQEEIALDMEKHGLYLRPRFSPGYGDFDIRHQKDMVECLECPKKIGLTMTDSFMLTPVKSVTAVIGLSLDRQECPVKGCEACGKIDCNCRRS